jgi:hypothetical protein
LPASTSDPANSTPCTPFNTYPGACCASPGWPSSGQCICQAFICYSSSSGGSTCGWDEPPEGSQAPTTSATGSSCCAYERTMPGSPNYECSCDAFDCKATIASGNGQAVSSCTINAIPPCGGLVTPGYSQVSSCSGG